jgi:hypothetical protein
MKPPGVTLTGPRPWRLLYFAGTVKLLLSPGRAGGLPKGNYPWYCSFCWIGEPLHNNMPMFFTSLRLFIPLSKIELAMSFSDNGVVGFSSDISSLSGSEPFFNFWARLDRCVNSNAEEGENGRSILLDFCLIL